MSWYLDTFTILLWTSFLIVMMAVITMVLSIAKGERVLAVNEMRIYVKLETKERLTSWQKMYAKDNENYESENQLVRSMGILLSADKLKLFRDLISSVSLLIVLMNWYFYEGNLFVGLLSVAVIYSTLWPSVTNFTIFSNVLGPALQKFRRYRVTRETHVLLLLLRNEVQEVQQRNVLSLIQKYQSYFKLIKQDLLILEHEWGKGKEIALLHLQQRHPNNEEIAYLASMLRDMEDLDYAELDKMLKENSETLNKKQQSRFESRENDLNQMLFLINIAGTGLAVLWFVISMFQWSYSFDTNY